LAATTDSHFCMKLSISSVQSWKKNAMIKFQEMTGEYRLLF
jgi:hypothetical protein